MGYSRSAFRLMALLLGAVVHASPVLADATEGARIAEQWRSSCHATGTQRKTTPDVAPPFAVMANDPAYPRERITGFLWSPHPPMPQFDLTRDQVNSLADYIESLRGP